MAAQFTQLLLQRSMRHIKYKSTFEKHYINKKKSKCQAYLTSGLSASSQSKAMSSSGFKDCIQT